MMQPTFDTIAQAYDASFSHTPVGIAQRSLVWKFTKPFLPCPPGRILEINCGTGIDAEWLAAQGHQVVATDISEEMRMITEKRNAGNASIKTAIWDLTQPLPDMIGEQDFIWSNFGGLNCLDPEQLKITLQQLDQCLAPGGKIALVLMGKFCFMQRLYFFLQRNFSAMRRRNSMQAVVLSENSMANIYYYTPKKCQALCPSTWKRVSLKPIGIFIPPSYLNAYCEKHPVLFKCLQFADAWVNRISFLANISDHYLCVMQKQKSA